MSKPLLVCRKSDDEIKPKLKVFCVGYEQGRWRAQELVRDAFRRHLTSFALSYSEWQKVDGDSAAAALARSAKMVYDTDKYERRGEFGELILHGILRDFYGAEPAVSKIFFLDSPNETAKGFDAVHVVVDDTGELDVWLGEAKLYTDMKSAINAVVRSIQDHISNEFLRREFIAVSNKFDDGWPHSAALTELLDENTSLDVILDRIVMPVLLTFQSDVIARHNKVSDAYIEDLLQEAQEAWEIFKDGLPADFPVVIAFIVLPLKETKAVRDLAHNTLMTYQTL
ncbi:DUF1837 domain-containing protein [Pseudokineococcus marinus]|uniref:DUF1837 domain-containing protein n=1 Tax=Pseudokineococcus marinus TaxID=351215 RepID=A0A849BVF0_9ACTN|nr:DUF1837 domain-containing protein [Pseudokineococcus marinus]NNH21538.1 DUF1837 domain-containing protein [Pseudokineococcus marinus]